MTQTSHSDVRVTVKNKDSDRCGESGTVDEAAWRSDAFWLTVTMSSGKVCMFARHSLKSGACAHRSRKV